jgi:hypothetical protein
MLIGEAGGEIPSEWTSSIPPVPELEDKIAFARELRFMVENKAELGQPWDVGASQLFNLLVQRLEVLYGAEPVVTKILAGLRESLSGISLFSPADFVSSFSALKMQLGILTDKNVDQFMSDLRSMVDNKIDGEGVITTNFTLTDFKVWLESSAGQNPKVKAKGGVADLLTDLALDKPVSVSERLDRLETLSQIPAGGFSDTQKTEVERQVGKLILSSGAGTQYVSADTRLSPGELRRLRDVLLKLQAVHGMNFADQIAFLGDPLNIPDFEDFINARVAEIEAHCDDAGLWIASKDNLTHEGTPVTIPEILFDSFNLRSFWDLLRRWDEWNPNKTLPAHMVPQKVLLNRVKTSIESGMAGEAVEDIGQNVSVVLGVIGK